MSAVPDGLPSLARGSHAPEDGKACIMEYVSVLTGDRFGDMPNSTMDAISFAAQALNDCLADEDRHLLIPFVGRLAEAGSGPSTFALCNKLKIDYDEGDPYPGGGYILWRVMKEKIGRLFTTYSYDPDAGLKFLDEILTAHEELTGRDAAPVPNEALAKARVLIESGNYIQGVTIS